MFHNPIKVDNVNYPSARTYLESHHPQDCLFKPRWLDDPVIKVDTLLDKIMNTEECDAGFVVVQKGARELANDEISKLFGFCLQKNSPKPSELGPEAILLAKEIVGKNIYKRPDEEPDTYNQRIARHVVQYLKNRVKTDFTLTRQSFVTDQCLPVPYFKFLVKKRGMLPSVKILHYIHYEGRSWASNFMKSLLQDRHDLILAGFKNGLGEKIAKLTANSYYGQTMMERNKFHRYTYANDSHLRKKPAFTATNISLLGAVKKNIKSNTKKKKLDKYSLMYLVKYPETNTKIKMYARRFADEDGDGYEETTKTKSPLNRNG